MKTRVLLSIVNMEALMTNKSIYRTEEDIQTQRQAEAEEFIHLLGSLVAKRIHQPEPANHVEAAGLLYDWFFRE